MVCYICIFCLILINLASSTDIADHNRRSTSTCPCEDASLCEPIPPAKGKTRLAYSKEPGNWKYYDFTKITEMVLFFDITEIDPEIVCVAHKYNVQLHLRGCFGNETFRNSTKQEKWIQENLKLLTDYHLDGINVDYERPRIAQWEPQLVDFMVELSIRVRSMNSNYQLTYCLPTDPLLHYEMVTIPTVMDYLMIMDYDHVWDIHPNHCFATANQQPMKTIFGLTKYMSLGIPPSKLVVGMPWYGYLYNCDNITSSGLCSLHNCPYINTRQSIIPKIYENYVVNGNYEFIQGWDNETVSPFLTIIPKDNIDSFPRQFWYDNSVSLTRKAEIYKPFQIRGVGVFHVDCLDYTMDQSMVTAYWNFFTVFQD
ncbi:Di-N-acetylchitobiase-like [Oopsacas minuta]|uniref:Di-N-acetylchitobiase-like n=1 Tax=Oopsacas minuta TaxID=111878 RepID=A0AAV7KG19_9METZ|nr:Di-N-acetylchitobiase-like [Oopsacas minuta]